MGVRKAIIKKGGDTLIPVTRGEVVLDSKGNQALHSTEFVATTAEPGLITPEEKETVSNALYATIVPDSKVVTVLRKDPKTETGQEVYPTTIASAVKITVNGTSTDLDKVIEQVLTLDDAPTQGSAKAVKSGGVWQYIDNTVGAIHRTVNTI